MDIAEWNIETTSDKCSHRVYVKKFIQEVGEEEKIEQCDHPYNDSKACMRSECPIRIKE